MIQAAVSRNRESLADASAVQFTRDPTGLRNALVKIGAHAEGSRFADADAEEVAHMVFAPALQRAFATHPPLVERIREIDPRFQPAEFAEVRRRLEAARKQAEEAAAQETAARRRAPFEAAMVLAPAAIAELVANPGTEHVQQAQAILASIPAAFQDAAREPAKAGPLLLALAMDTAPDARELQLAFVQEQFGATFHGALVALLPEVDALTSVQKMPALLQVFGALAELPRAERVGLLRGLNGLMVRESRASAFGYALRKLAQVQLHDNLHPGSRTAGHLGPQGVRDDLQVLFSVLAVQGTEEEAAARQAYEAGMQLILPGIHPPLARLGHWPPKLDQALVRIDRLKPEAKSELVKALLATISHDGRMTASESELLRAICAVLHCPLPPLY
jgi:hypothetical protein